MVKLSVIVVSKDSEKCIGRAIKSLESQTFKDFEVIFVDAVSKDGTMKLIKAAKLKKKIICEKDKGIYDAMNKGARNASGEVIYFLNTDDYLVDNKVFEKAMPFFVNGVALMHGSTRVLIDGVSTDYFYALNDETLSGKGFPAQQCCFYLRELFLELGGYDINYKLAADFDLLCKFNTHLKLHDFRIQELGFPIAYLTPGGASGVEGNVGFEELGNVIRKHFGDVAYYSWRLPFDVKSVFRGALKATNLLDAYRTNVKKNVVIAPKTRVIPNLYFEVCSPCQNNCKDCAHKELIASTYNFHLSLQELKKFIECTKQSNYFIEELSIHGPGEPTLWRDLNEGLKMIYESKIANKIIITSNGHSLDRLNDASWNYITSVNVSHYPDIKVDLSKYKSKIKIIEATEFRSLPTRRYPNTIPCPCAVPGPMFMKDKIFLSCGPPIYDAALLAKVGILDDKRLWTPLEVNYMDKYDKKLTGNLSLCEYCFGNLNIKADIKPHTQEDKPRKIGRLKKI